MRVEQDYITLFHQAESLINENTSEILNSRRAQALANFKEQGFPTRKDERYLYTDIAPLFEPNYGLNIRRLQIPVNPYKVFRCDVPNLTTSLYFMHNDSFYHHAQPSLPDGVLFGSLNELSAQYPELVNKFYGRLADTSKDGIAALNTLFAQDGLLCYIPHGVRIEKPIQLVKILRADVDLMVNRRLLIVLEDNTEASLLMCDHTMDDVNFLSTQVIEVFVGKGATLRLYGLEETSERSTRLSQLYIRQEAGSTVQCSDLTLHNGTTRNTSDISLAGKGATLSLSGMAIADKRQQIDNYTFVEHAAPDCTSEELYKYVLDDEAVGAFAGKVLVRPDAQRTSSRQTNRNLCATRQARAYSQPQLEIYADDVKCSHGATTGQLDENALFYMKTRGIAEREARLLLMSAFVNEVIDNISLEALRDRLHLLVDKRFRGELARCKGCSC
ncbi:MAG: Fe-S cluster assembly protein SufD [Prevotellaceae bacterium]|jgi:Fe-S cluster assembly protein SufD|nr:Fe-S cluster assembly protein SufD [Prevotellaceae bacterium]